MAMTFVEICDAVIKNAFKEGRRAEVEQWVIARHAWLWDAEEWTFKQDDAAVTFTAGSQVVATPTDFQTAIAVYDSNGRPIKAYEDHVEFYDRYNTNLDIGTGAPEAFTVVAGQLIVGPAGDGTTGLLLYERSKPTLDADADSSDLPDGYDLALVHGGKAEGFKLSNVPLWQGFDDDFNAFLNAMRRNYLTSVRASGAKVMGAFRPGG